MQFILAVAVALALFSSSADAMLERRSVFIRRFGSKIANEASEKKSSLVKSFAAGTAIGGTAGAAYFLHKKGVEIPICPDVSDVCNDLANKAVKASMAIVPKSFKPKLGSTQPKIEEPESSSSSSNSESESN